MTRYTGQRLITPSYMAFPFKVDSAGSATSTRSEHVRQQIEQVLFTNPFERVFRPEFGAGLRRLVFEPNNRALWSITRRRLNASLAQALHGEVDPKTIDVQISSEEETLIIQVSYMLAAIGKQETQQFSSTAGGGNG
jgi:Bacteriophage baseplate protein W